jgi:hypothetical protein
MKEPEILIQESSHRCPIEAIVEQDDRVAYFYLHSDNKEFGVKSCWVRNLIKAPQKPDVESMKKGIPPLLSSDYCTHVEGAPPLKKEDLKLVWFEEGDAAALLEKNEIITIIPSWSGYKGFYGFSKDCIGESNLCWYLGTPETNVLYARVNRNIKYWDDWEKENIWQVWQEKLIDAIEGTLGKHDKYYAIDGDKWPPKAMLKIMDNVKIVFTTAGVSLVAQPKVEEDGPKRIELAIAIDNSFNNDEIMKFAGYISAQTNLPWENITWLGKGHTIPCDCLPKSKFGSKFNSVLLISDNLGVPEITFDKFRDDDISILWMIPITQKEREYAMKYNSSKLIDQFKMNGIDWIFKDRKEVQLK